MGVEDEEYVPLSEQQTKDIASAGIPSFDGSSGKISEEEKKHQKKQDKDKKEAKDNTWGDFDIIKNVNGTVLNKHQNSNYAKDGGQYGSLNGKSFENTLHASRAADAYNNRPKEDMFYLMGGGTQKIDADYDRKEIETEEMREMQRNRQLDLNQKQLAQQLQAAINKKDYDAFIDAYKQMYGIELDAYHAKNIMNQWLRQQEVMQHVNNYSQYFMKQLGMYFDIKKAKMIYEIAKDNPILSELLFSVFIGGDGSPSQAHMIEQTAWNHEYRKYYYEFAKKMPPSQAQIKAKQMADKILMNDASHNAWESSTDAKHINRKGMEWS